MKKLSIGIAMILIISMVLSLVPMIAIAKDAEFELGDFNYDGDITGNPTLMGWCTDGRDDIKTTLDLATLKAAKKLVVEFSAALPGNVVFILQSEANWWDQKEGVKADGTILTIDLTAMPSWAGFLKDGTQANFLIGDWSNDYWATIDVVKAVLISEEEDDAEEPDDGDDEDAEDGEDGEDAEEPDDGDEEDATVVAPEPEPEPEPEEGGGEEEPPAVIAPPPPASNPYKDHYVGAGISVIPAVEFDNDDFHEFTVDYHNANSSWFNADTNLAPDTAYVFRPEYADDHSGPQTENAEVPGLGNIGAVAWTIGEWDDDGDITPAEWVQYTINVTKASRYLVSVWASSGGAGGNIDFYAFGMPLGSAVVTPTGGWGNYQMFNVGIVDLAPGTYIIKTVFPTGDLNFAAIVATELYGATAAPVIDGIIDPIWESTEAFYLEKVKVGEDTGIESYFKVMNDGEKLYVLVVVPDTTPNHEHNDNYQRDGIEIPIDFYNTKSTSYGDDQINCTFFANGDDFVFGRDGNGVWTEEMIEWAVIATDAGYIYEIAYNYAAAGIELEPGATIGMDMQVNDNAEGTGRTACYAWSDEIDQVWQNPSVMGNIKFLSNGTSTVGEAPKGEETEESGGGDDSKPGGGGDDVGGPGAPDKPNPQSGDNLFIPFMLIALLGAVVFVVKKVRVR